METVNYDGHTYRLSDKMLEAGVTIAMLYAHGWNDETAFRAGHLVPVHTIDDRMREAWGEERIAVPTFDDPSMTMPAPKGGFTCPMEFDEPVCATISDTTFQLMTMLQQRDAKGREKYGTTLDRKDLSLTEWLQHQTEELLDGAGYAQAAKREAERLLRIETAARNATVLLQGCEFAWEARDALKQLEGALRS